MNQEGDCKTAPATPGLLTLREVPKVPEIQEIQEVMMTIIQTGAKIEGTTVVGAKVLMS